MLFILFLSPIGSLGYVREPEGTGGSFCLMGTCCLPFLTCFLYNP
jgi:hypothetical protein